MEMVGLDYETYKDKSPFDLSGGQKEKSCHSWGYSYGA